MAIRKLEYRLVYQNSRSSFPKTAICYSGRTQFKPVTVVKFGNHICENYKSSNRDVSVLDVYLDNTKTLRKFGRTHPYVAKVLDADTGDNLVVFDFFKCTLDDLKLDEIFERDSNADLYHFTPQMQKIVRELVNAFLWLRAKGFSLWKEYSAKSIIFQDDNIQVPKLMDIWHTKETELPKDNLQRLARVLNYIATKFGKILSPSVQGFLAELNSGEWDACQMKLFPCLWKRGSSRKFVIEATLSLGKDHWVADWFMKRCTPVANPTWQGRLASDNDLADNLFQFFTDSQCIVDCKQGKMKFIDDMYGLLWYTRCLFVHYNQWAISNNANILTDELIEEKVENLSPMFFTRAVVGLVKGNLFPVSRKSS